MNVFGQTVLQPVINIALFLAIFVFALGGKEGSASVASGSYSGAYISFLLPGLIMMSVIQNSFANSSSSILISKMHGIIIDIVMAPITTIQFLLAYSLAGVTRSLFILSVVVLPILVLTDIKIYSIAFTVLFLLLGGFLLSVLGVIAAVRAQRFDHIATFTNLFIVPFSFLSGTFYSFQNFPEKYQFLILYNPFFHLISGMRYAFTGYSEVGITTNITFSLVCNIVLFAIAYVLIRKGYGIKS